MSKFDDFDNNFNDSEIEKAIRKGYYHGIDGILMERVEMKE